MPTVTGPDGRKLRFPKGTDPNLVVKTLREQYPDADWSQQAPSAPLADFSKVRATVNTTADAASHPGPDGDGWSPGMGRDAMFGARSVLQGAGSLLGAAGGDAFNSYVVNPVARAAGAQEARTYREEAGTLADLLGLPRAQTAQDRVLGDVGEALTGTGLTLGVGGLLRGGAKLLGSGGIRKSLADFLTSQPLAQAFAAASGSASAGAARESGAGPIVQGVASLAAGFAPGAATGVLSLLSGGRTAAVGALPTLMAGGARQAVRGRETGGMREAIADFAAAGSSPSVGQASGGRTAQALETYLGNTPGGAGTVSKLGAQQAIRARAFTDELSNLLTAGGADLTPSQVGSSVERGIYGPKGFASRTGETVNRLYGKLDELIEPDSRVGVSNARATLGDMNSSIDGAPAVSQFFKNAKIEGIERGLTSDVGADGKLPYEALQKLRSVVGRQIDSTVLGGGDVSQGQWRRLYGALSRDMEAAATTPEARQALERANRYYRVRSERLEQLERIVNKAGGPEVAYQSLFAGAKNGATPLKRVMDSLPTEGRAEVTASFLQRMGRATKANQDATGDVFSMNTFLSNWADMSPEARKVLFSNARYGSAFVEDVNRIARMAHRIREGSQVFANSSGSSRQAALGVHLAGTALLAGQQAMHGNLGEAAIVIGSSAALAGMNNMLARAMTSPKFVAWLAKNTERDVGDTLGQIQALKHIGRDEDDPEILSLAEELERKNRP